MGHVKCTSEKQSKQIKIDAKVTNDLNEFLMKAFAEGNRVSDTEEESRRNSCNPELKDIDAFDYVQSDAPQKKKDKKKKLSKAQKKHRQRFLDESSNVLMPSSEEE